MDRAAGIKVEGQKELRRSLRKAGDDLEDLKSVHAEAAKIAEGGARPITPVRSGTLAGTVRSSGAKTSATLRAGKKAVPYAGPIHWGWPRRGIEPQPFLADGAKRTEPQWVEVFYEYVKKATKKVKGK